MTKYVIGLLVVILVLGGGSYLLRHIASTVSGQGSAGSAAQAPAVTTAYATTTFSIVYPLDFTVDSNYANDTVNPKKPIHGVKFTIPGAMATGTNLGGDTYISVESLPRAKRCTGDIYIAENVKPQVLTEASTTYSLATTSGAGAGNFYEESVYALSGSSPCTAVRYFIHSTNIGNYTPGAVRAFDHAALLSVFDTIRRSLVLRP